MKELEVKYLTLVDYDVKVKPYLSPAEVELIATNLLAEEDIFKRELLKKYYILTYCTDVEVDDAFDIELAVESGMYSEVECSMGNIYLIDAMIDKFENTTNVIKDFLVKLETKIPDAKTQKAMITKLQKMSKDFVPKGE